MKYGISLTPIIPVRDNPSEKSEMISQILFVEHFSIIDKNGTWVKIINSVDSYYGWDDKKKITEINSE